MKKYLLVILLAMSFYSCKKDADATNAPQYKDIVYRIQTTDSALQINLMRAVYNDAQKGNIGKDSVLLNPGLYNIPATVLTGANVSLFAMSAKGPNFNLTIVDTKGTVLAATDTITYYPANQLHGDQWISSIHFIP